MWKRKTPEDEQKAKARLEAEEQSKPKEIEFFPEEPRWSFDEMNRRFKNLELRTGKGTQLKIIVNGREHELYKKFPLGTKIIVRIL